MHNYLDQLIEKRADFLTKAKIDSIDSDPSEARVIISIPKGVPSYTGDFDNFIEDINTSLSGQGHAIPLRYTDEQAQFSIRSTGKDKFSNFLELVKNYIEKLNIHPGIRSNIPEVQKDNNYNNRLNKFNGEDIMDKKSMEINSNTILINKSAEAYTELETILNKIATEHGIDNVEGITISFSEEEGLISFKQSNFEYGGQITEEMIAGAQTDQEVKDLRDKLMQEFNSSKVTEDTSRHFKFLADLIKRKQIELHQHNIQMPFDKENMNKLNISDMAEGKGGPQTRNTEELEGLNAIKVAPESRV